MYSQQQKLAKEGKPSLRTIAIDYDERYAGTSLAHVVKNASQIYDFKGRLSYDSNKSRHEIGCILHAQGQNGKLIEKDIQMRIFETFKSKFVVPGRRITKFSSTVRQ
jgi:hypothetical protein